MRRAFLFVLDSFGIGGANDAAIFGDQGANTLGTIAAFCASRGAYTKPDILNSDQFAAHKALQIPNMVRLGLVQAAELASGVVPAGLEPNTLPLALWGAADEISQGKDTPSGHWEIAGLPVPFDWGYFPRSIPTFPGDLTNAIITQAELPGILGNCHASGIDIIQALGEEHIRTGKPILYTSADSVIQVAAHEQHFGLERLYQVCLMLRKLADPLNIGRIIARPFTGETPDDFERSPNRRDYAVPPPQDTLLDLVKNSGHQVFAVGKISDIFAGFGVTQSRKANGNDALFDASLQAMREAGDGDLVFSNFVDFDMLYGHRRDIAGYADALEAFDRRLPEAFALMQEGDLLVLTADHGCDPGWAGTDHTRERVPVLALGYGAGSIGLRSSFADISASIIEHLGLGQNHHDHKLYGMSFLPATGPKLEPVAG